MIPVISNTTYATLKALIMNCPPHLKTKEVGQLATELERADVVEDEEINKDVIALNSAFEIEDTETNKTWKLTLTLPDQANVKEQKISVFSPLGVALIGFRKGMTVRWALPGGLKTIKILHVTQPVSV